MLVKCEFPDGSLEECVLADMPRRGDLVEIEKKRLRVTEIVYTQTRIVLCVHSVSNSVDHRE
jgi:hypothetical protein